MNTQDVFTSFLNAQRHAMYIGHRVGGPNCVRALKLQARFLKLVYASLAVGAYFYGYAAIICMLWICVLWFIHTTMLEKVQNEEQREWFDSGVTLLSTLVLQESSFSLADAVEFIIATDRIHPLRVDPDTSDFLSGTDFRHGDIAFVLDNNTSSPISEDSMRQLFIANEAQTRGRNPFTNLPVQRLRKVRLEITA
jgi:hypothetical protein